MYCLKCRSVPETENITTTTSKNGKLMRRGQCITYGKLRLNSSKEMLPVKAFLILWCTNSLSKCISKVITLQVRVCDKTMLGELNGIVNPTLRERIDKSIVGKLIKAKVNFGLGHPVKKN